MRLRTFVPILLLLPVLASCDGDEARFTVTQHVAPGTLIGVTATDGWTTWHFVSTDFQVPSGGGSPMSPRASTSLQGTLVVRVELWAADSTVISDGSVSLPLKRDWDWNVDVMRDTLDPMRRCFGCVGSKAFAIAAAQSTSAKDSIWLVWGGNSIKHPVIY